MALRGERKEALDEGEVRTVTTQTVPTATLPQTKVVSATVKTPEAVDIEKEARVDNTYTTQIFVDSRAKVIDAAVDEDEVAPAPPPVLASGPTLITARKIEEPAVIDITKDVIIVGPPVPVVTVKKLEEKVVDAEPVQPPVLIGGRDLKLEEKVVDGITKSTDFYIGPPLPPVTRKDPIEDAIDSVPVGDSRIKTRKDVVVAEDEFEEVRDDRIGTRLIRDPLVVDGDTTDTFTQKGLHILPEAIEADLNERIEGRTSYKQIQSGQLQKTSVKNVFSRMISERNSSGDVLFARAIHPSHGSAGWPASAQIQFTNLVSTPGSASTTALYELVRGYLYRENGASAYQNWNSYLSGGTANRYIISKTTTADGTTFYQGSISGVRVVVFDRDFFKDRITPGTFVMKIKPTYYATLANTKKAVNIDNETESESEFMAVTATQNQSLLQTVSAGPLSSFTIFFRAKFTRNGPRYQTLFHRRLGNASLSSWNNQVVTKRYSNLNPKPAIAKVEKTNDQLFYGQVITSENGPLPLAAITTTTLGVVGVTNTGSTGSLFFGASGDKEWIKFIWPIVPIGGQQYESFASGLSSWSGQNGVQLSNISGASTMQTARWAVSTWTGGITGGRLILFEMNDYDATGNSAWTVLSKPTNKTIAHGASELIVKFDLALTAWSPYNLLYDNNLELIMQVRRDMPSCSGNSFMNGIWNPRWGFGNLARGRGFINYRFNSVNQQTLDSLSAISAIEHSIKLTDSWDDTFNSNGSETWLGIHNSLKGNWNVEWHVKNLEVRYKPGTVTASQTATITAYADSSITGYNPDYTWYQVNPQTGLKNRYQQWNGNIVIYDNHPWIKDQNLPKSVPIQFIKVTQNVSNVDW